MVVLTCNAPLRANRLSKIAKALSVCYVNAKNEFDATHDLLTLLPNRASFESTLVNGVASLAGNPTVGTSPIIGPATNVLTLLAFDLDHFKQINDTYGHPYGDVVLAAFAWRLADFAEEIEKTRNLKTHVARLGGEEFQLLIVGLADENDGLLLANEFRQRVKNTPLPSDREWLKISARRGISDDRLPSLSERTLSVSIGHALITSPEVQLLLTSLGTDIRVSSMLIQQADIALYRAKSDGRDCARSFREIRDRLGRVLEHHSETGIVTIDIGTDVGVKSGMEFLVYHPQFYGNHPFYQSDGRTRKRLGTYPKYPSGRLTVFETSGEISFAQVIENKQQSLFPVGSRLEYVPLGSFTHLVTSPLGHSQANLASYDQLIDRTKELIEAKKRVVAVNLAIQDMESIVVARGTAHGNDILASVFRSIRESFGGQAAIAMTSATEFLVLTDYDKETSEEQVFENVRTITTQVSASARCAAGIYDSKTTQINTLKPEMAIECARMARSLKDQISQFNDATAQQVIQNWRARQSWDEGIADYNRLKSFGLSSATMENAAGLCYIERRPIPDYQSAIQCFKTAVSLAQKSTSKAIYELNLAYTYSANSDHGSAVDIFRRYPLKSVNEKSEMSPVYVGAYARSIYFLNKANQLKLPKNEAELALKEAITLDGNTLSQDWTTAIQDLIQSLRNV